MKLTAYMKRYKVTVRVLAEKVGVTERSIINYRNGDIPTGNIIKKIVKATGGNVTAIDMLR